MKKQKKNELRTELRKTLAIGVGVHTKLKAASALSGRSIESLASEILERYLNEQWETLLKSRK
jgi:hypothetical protein